MTVIALILSQVVHWELFFTNQGFPSVFARPPFLILGNILVFGGVRDLSPGQGHGFFTGVNTTDGIVLWDREFQETERNSIHTMSPSANGFYAAGQCLINRDSLWHILTIRIDDSGNILWWRVTLNPYQDFLPVSALSDQRGNLVVVGTTVKTQPGIYDIILHSWDSAGTHRWSTTYNSPWNDRDTPWGAAMDKDGNTYVVGDYWRVKSSKTGLTNSPVSGIQWKNGIPLVGLLSPESCLAVYPLALKVDSAGHLVWVDNYEYWSRSGQFMFCEYGDGRLYVSGHEITGALYSECMDEYGQQMWHYRNDEYFFSISYGDNCVDQNGNLYLIGRKSSPDPGLFVLSLDLFGRLRFFNVLHPDAYGYSISADSLGNIFVGGTANNPKSADFLVMKLDTTGNIKWLYQKDGGLPGYDQKDECYALLPDNRGGVFAIGGLHDSLMTTMQYLVHLTDTTGGISEGVQSLPGIILTPAPSGFFISGYGGEARIYDPAGRLIIKREIAGKTLISPLSPGVYFVVAGKERARVAVR